MPNKRIGWIDALKGFGMILVIIGHMSIPEMMRQFIFSFHMPLFFFISGYLYNGGFSAKWTLRKLDSLLIPYVVYGAITLAVWMFVGKIDLKTGLNQLIDGNGLGLTWFFMCMLLTELFGGLLIWLGRVRVPQASNWSVMILGIAILGWFMPRLGLPSYCKSNVVPAALAFWLAGYLLKNREFRWYELVLAIVLASFFWYQRIDMNSTLYGNGFLFYGTALGFVTLLLWVFKEIEISWGPLTFIGERSIEFMCLHGLIPMFFTESLLRMGIVCPKSLMRILCLTLVVVCAWLIHRHIRLLSGRISVFQRLIPSSSPSSSDINVS
jgi:acyltransferase